MSGIRHPRGRDLASECTRVMRAETGPSEGSQVMSEPRCNEERSRGLRAHAYDQRTRIGIGLPADGRDKVRRGVEHEL